MNWKRAVRWLSIAAAAATGIAAIVVGYHVVRFNSAANAAYDVDSPDIVAVTDSEVIARGEHLAESLGGCITCHGPGLGGLETEDMGPVGKMFSPNLTSGRGGVGNDYTDAELARAVQHGIKKDGRSLLFMPAYEFSWWPDGDVVALVSFIRSVPPIDNEPPQASVGLLGKLLTGFGVLEPLSARGIDHDADPEEVPDPEPTARYGRFVARGCIGCHGEGFSGGRIPGTPSSIPTPTNLTPHETGLAGWTEAEFVNSLNTGVRPDGTRLDSFMPIAATAAMNDVEKRALWAYLSQLEPLNEGNR